MDGTIAGRSARWAGSDWFPIDIRIRASRVGALRAIGIAAYYAASNTYLCFPGIIPQLSITSSRLFAENNGSLQNATWICITYIDTMWPSHSMQINSYIYIRIFHLCIYECILWYAYMIYVLSVANSMKQRVLYAYQFLVVSPLTFALYIVLVLHSSSITPVYASV